LANFDKVTSLLGWGISVVDVIIALEAVRIDISIVVALYLNHRVVELVLTTTQICNFTKSLQRVV